MPKQEFEPGTGDTKDRDKGQKTGKRETLRTPETMTHSNPPIHKPLMRAMILDRPNTALRLVELPTPTPATGQVLIQIQACAVCRTDLHIIDGELTEPKLPLVLGHQIVGTIVRLGDDVYHFQIGQRVGVPWLGKSCGSCRYCQAGKENLCEKALYTGYHLDGGFAEYCLVYADFCFLLPESIPPEHIAPLLCGGFIGYRALRMTDDAKRIGFYGFGSSAHILIQIARHQSKEVFVFTRPGETEGQQFAKKMGAVWAGSSEEIAPVPLDAAIIFAPVGSLVPMALRAVDKGGIVVCAGIYMSDIPTFPYCDLWGERILRSVTNLTRQDGREFLALAQKHSIHTKVAVYKLEQANEALQDLRHGRLQGTAVIRI